MTSATSTAPAAAPDLRRDPRLLAALDAAAPAGWRSRGSCLTVDPEVFFPTLADDPAAALAVCRRCPVQAPCLAAALATGECDGVWGATTPEERRIMRRAWDRLASPRPRTVAEGHGSARLPASWDGSAVGG